MKKNGKILALIIARKNSKGLKNKNILKLGGQPIINWTMESAIKSKYIDYNSTARGKNQDSGFICCIIIFYGKRY